MAMEKCHILKISCFHILDMYKYSHMTSTTIITFPTCQLRISQSTRDGFHFGGKSLNFFKILFYKQELFVIIGDFDASIE